MVAGVPAAPVAMVEGLEVVAVAVECIAVERFFLVLKIRRILQWYKLACGQPISSQPIRN